MAVTDKKVSARAAFARKSFRPGRIPDGVLTPVTIGIHSTAAQFTLSAFLFAIGGKIYKHAASTAHTFSAVHATGIAKWMAIALFIDGTDTITTRSNPNTGDQDAASEAAALATVAAMIASPTAGQVHIGTITILTNAADWDANTDDISSADVLAHNLAGVHGDRRVAQFLPGYRYRVEGVHAPARAVTGTAHLEILTVKKGFTGVLTHPRLEVDDRRVAAATNIKIRVGSFLYAINGVVYWKAEETAIAFSAAHVVSIDKWGVVQVRINTAGTVSTHVGEVAETTAMAYTNSAAARAAAPAVAAGYCQVGIIVIEAGAAAWDANTDDLIAASDLENLDVLPDTTSRILSSAGLALDTGEKEDFKCATFTYVIRGVKYTKTAATGIDFTAAHVCAASKYLAILVAINAAGTISTRVPLVDGRSQTASQGFDTANEAIAALPNAAVDTVRIGYILIANNAGAWTANTDDMDAGVDVTTATFHSDDPAVNQHYAVEGQGYGANSHAELTLATRKQATIGDEASQIVALISGTDGVLTDPQVDITYRPYPMNAES